jgi:hypothetical protein
MKRQPTVSQLDARLAALEAKIKDLVSRWEPEHHWRTGLIMRLTRIEQAIEMIDSHQRGSNGATEL